MELILKINNGYLDLASSGIVLVDGDQPTKVSIYEKDDDTPLDIIIKFVNNKYSKSGYIDRQIDEHTVEIVFTNFNDPIGHRIDAPWRIGTAYNRELYFVFAISGEVHHSLKIIQYSFYLGKKV
jgi:hypothetical protein